MIKHLFFWLMIILPAATITAQQDNPDYDKALADTLGADDYGMKQYVLVILKTGTNTTQDKQIRDSLFRGHMKNINKLVNEGKLIVAGPLSKNDKAYRGIFILNVPTIAEAEKLVMTDPAVQAKIFDMELFQWYGSAALPKYLEYHGRIEKKKH